MVVTARTYRPMPDKLLRPCGNITVGWERVAQVVITADGGRLHALVLAEGSAKSIPANRLSPSLFRVNVSRRDLGASFTARTPWAASAPEGAACGLRLSRATAPEHGYVTPR